MPSPVQLACSCVCAASSSHGFASHRDPAVTGLVWLQPELKVGQLCVAQYSADGQLYRAYVERVNMTEPQYDIFFIDYGNKEKVNSKAVRPISAALAAVPPQAHLCTLAYIKVCALSKDWLWSLVLSK